MNFTFKNISLAKAIDKKPKNLIAIISNKFEIKNKKDPIEKLIKNAIDNKDFTAEVGQTLNCYGALKETNLILLGVGSGLAKEISDAFEKSNLQSTLINSPVIAFEHQITARDLAATVIGAQSAAYKFSATKTDKQEKKEIKITISAPKSSRFSEEDYINTLDLSKGIAKGVELAREWGNMPPNHATPTLLAKAAQKLENLPNIKCEIMTPKQVHELGMGAFEAVAKGSDEELRLITLRYEGIKDKKVEPIALVGKGITFDSGGISLKPGPEMDEMKFDMCGAASVLGTFEALGQIQPPVNVIGIIAACENLPSGKALKPGDVIKSMDGQTIEVLNTDAEGRLILCDAITYARTFNPKIIIDIATLTGACVISLGSVRTGIFSNNDEIAKLLVSAGQAAHDKAWQMPLDEEYAAGLKSNFADMANIAGREAGSITAAKFLEKFTKGTPWAHLDIAGTAWKRGAAKGATGRPVRLLTEYLLGEAAQNVKKNKSPKKTKKAK